jgi:pyrimidine-specific ribonucleoside hydrolase
MIKHHLIVMLSGLMAALLLGCVNTASPSLEPMTPHAVAADAQPVVIDTDMAVDDWLAILYLLGRPDVDVQAITVTGAGEAHCSAGTRNALDLIALAGRPEIPVACGREAPLAGDHTFPTEWRKRVDDLLGLTLPKNSREASSASAVELLTRIIQRSPQKVHLITLGPLTNVGEALATEPGLVMNLEMITVMGGAVEVAGNVGSSSSIENEVAEWNFYVDPRAAAEVLKSGAPITLAPLDATNYAPLTMAFYRRLERDRATSVAEFVYRVLAAQEENVRSGEYYFWDPLAAAIATEEGLGTFREISLIVVEEEGAESGRTIESDRGDIIRVAMTADRERFEALFLDAVNGRLP